MNGFASKLWHWLINRSPRNAATPEVQAQSANDGVNSAQSYWGQQIETNIETQSILGLLLRMASIDSMSRAPDGELVRKHDDETVVLLGCGHLGTLRRRADQENNNIKKIAGQCHYCAADLQQELVSGASIDSRAFLHKELKTLVCEDCGKITTSNHLACPDHYTKVVTPDGSDICVDEEQVKEIKRQDTVRMALGIVKFLFSEGQQEISDKKDKE